MKRQIPKNVRQIGNVSDSSKIYVEDYVDTFMNQLSEKADQAPIGAFLIGETVQEENEDYIYIYGAVQMKEITQKGRDIFIDEGTWKKACEQCKEFFGDAEILGWFLTSVGQAMGTTHNILKVHQKLFSREKSVFVVKDAREKEEKYYIHKYKDLMECSGHYIYYERNVEMQNYMIASRKKTGMTPSEIIEDTVTKNFRGIIRDKMEKNEQKSRSKTMYAMSTFLILVVLIIGVTMLNNYDKMQGVKSTLEKLNEDKPKEDDVVETLGTIVDTGDNLIDDEQEETEGEEPETDVKKEEPKEDIIQGAEKIPDDTQSEQTTTPAETVSEPEQRTYTVKKGDTLASISKEIYGDISHVDAICKMNGLADGNLILIGQKLLLP